MPEKRPARAMLPAQPRVGDTVVLRPTSRQRIGSALLKGCCALPLLLAMPVATGRPQMIILLVFVLSAVAAMAIDVLAQREVWLKVSPAGIASRSGSIPWWAIDDIHIHDQSPLETVAVRSFETIEMILPAPRNGPTGSNPRFQDEARFIIANWNRYRQVRPVDPMNLRASLEHAKSFLEALPDVQPDVIDLRTPDPVNSASGGRDANSVGRPDYVQAPPGQAPRAPRSEGTAAGHDLPHPTDLLRPS